MTGISVLHTSEVSCVKYEWWSAVARGVITELQGVTGVITAVKCSLAAQQTTAHRLHPGCFYNKPSEQHGRLRQVHESKGFWQKLTRESHIHLWNALLLSQMRESSPGPTKLKYAKRPLVELHAVIETDMYFPEALFVKEMVA